MEPAQGNFWFDLTQPRKVYLIVLIRVRDFSPLSLLHVRRDTFYGSIRPMLTKADTAAKPKVEKSTIFTPVIEFGPRIRFSRL